MDTGHRHMADKDFRAAAEAFAAADVIMEVPTTSLALGKAQIELGLFLEAVNSLRRAARFPVVEGEPEVFAGARKEAAELDYEVARRIPSITIIVKGSTAAEVTVDGEKLDAENVGLPYRVNPGEHTIVAGGTGLLPTTSTITIEEKQSRRVELVVKTDPNHKPDPVADPAPPTPPREEGMPSWLLPAVGFGVGGAGLILGTVTGLVSINKTNKLEDACGGPCPESRRDDYDEIITLANVSNVGFVVGAAGAAVGVVGLVLMLTGDDDETTGGLPIIVTPHGLGLHLSF